MIDNIYLRHVFEFAVLIPASMFALLPVRDQVRSRFVYIFAGLSILVAAFGGAWICVSYDLSTNNVILPMAPVLLIGYLYTVKTSLFQKLFCFGNAMMLTTFGTMYTNYLTAKIEMGHEGEPFTLMSSLICLGVDLVLLLIFFRALYIWIPYFISEELLNRVWINLFPLTVIMTGLFFWLTPLRASNVVHKRTQQIGLVLISFIPIVLWAFFYIAWWTAKRHRDYALSVRENDMLSMENKRYQKFREYFDETRAMRHDFRQQILVLNRYAEEEDFERLKKYIKEYSSNLREAPIRLCDNIPIDAVVSYYKGIADQKGIDMKTVLQIPSEIPWDDAGICSVFGNLLENAVRETDKVTDRTKEISVVSKMISEGMMGISVENPYEGEIKFARDGLPKAEKRDHGVGLRSVKMIVEKRHGVMSVTAEDGRFFVNILLNRNEK